MARTRARTKAAASDPENTHPLLSPVFVDAGLAAQLRQHTAFLAGPGYGFRPGG